MMGRLYYDGALAFRFHENFVHYLFGVPSPFVLKISQTLSHDQRNRKSGNSPILRLCIPESANPLLVFMVFLGTFGNESGLGGVKAQKWLEVARECSFRTLAMQISNSREPS
jgi:hypothetical protein